MSIDEHFTLMGDEDCGVELNCRTCKRDGMPISYYACYDTKAYEGTDVIIVKTINALLIAGRTHIARKH